MSTETAPVQTEQPTETPTVIDPVKLEALTEATLRQAPAAEIARLKADLHAKPAETKTEKTEESETVTETPTTEATEEPVQTEEEKAAAKAPEPTEEEEQEPKDGKKRRFRFADPNDELIALTAKRKGISLAEAARRLEGEPKETKETPKEIPNLEPTVAELQTELATVREKLDKAIGTGEEDAVLITPAIRKLQSRESELLADIKAELKAAKVAEAQTKIVEGKISEAEFTRQRNDVLRATVKVYPEMANRDSAQFLLSEAIGQRWRNPEHPDHDKLFSVEGPRLIAEESAKQLRIVPANQVKTEVKKETVEKPKPGPAPGSRQSAPPTPKQSLQERQAASEAKLNAALAGKAKFAPSKPKSYVM